MDLDNELLRGFDRVTGQCNEANKKSSNINIFDNTGCSEKECSMITMATVGSTEVSGSNVKCENPEIMKVAEHGGIGPSSFRPNEAVLTPSQMSEKLENAIPEFVSKLYKIVDDPNTDTVVHWELDGQSFVVVDDTKFCKDILPRYYKHKKFSSFIKQLNNYGFRKIDCDRWEYATKEFQRGKRELLKYMKRSYKKMSLGSGKQDETLEKSLRAQISKLSQEVEVRISEFEKKELKYMKQYETLEKYMCAQITNLRQEVEVSSSRLSAFEKNVHLMELKYMKMSKTIGNPGLIAGDQTEIPSEQEMANTLVVDDDPKQSSASKRLCMSAPSCVETSCRPHEAVFADPFAGVNPVSLVSTANVKQSDPLVTVSEDMSVLRKPCAKHGLGNYNYIEITSSDDDDPSEQQQSRSKDKADFSPDQLKVESKLPSESDHETPEASVGLKRKCTSCINEDVTEALSSPPIGIDSSPHLLTQEGKKVRPSNEHLTPPSVAGIPDSVNSSQPKEVTRSHQWKKSLLEKVRKVLDEDSSGYSYENSDD